MVSVEKWSFVQLYFLGNVAQENVFYHILKRKNAFLDYKNKKFRKVEKLTFFQRRNPWFRSKNGQFSTFIFQEIKTRKMSFTIFQNEKTPCQTIKIESLKSRKIDIFPKGLSHCFGPKMAIFPTFIFQAMQVRKMSFTIFQNEKTPFQTIKTKSSKSPKMAIFPSVIFQEIQARKMSFTIFQNKKRLSRLDNQEVQIVEEVDIFPKR